MGNTEIKPATPQQDQLAKIKSAAEKRFEAITVQANELLLRVEKIDIKNETSLAIAQQTLSEVKRIEKMVEDKRVEIKAPYLQAGKEIDAIAKRVLGPLDTAMEKGDKKLRAWNAKQEEAANAQKAINEKKYTFLKALEKQIQDKLALCKSTEQYASLANNIATKWPGKETFGIYGDEAIKVKDNFIGLIKTKIDLFQAATGNDSSAAATVSEKIEEAQAITAQASETASVIEEKKGIAATTAPVFKTAVRKTWKHEVIDEKALPRQFLSADDKKIRDYFNANVKTGVEEKGMKEIIAGGVRFYLDEAPTIR